MQANVVNQRIVTNPIGSETMSEGSVVSIQIAVNAKGPMQCLQEVSAIEGKGLEGDREG